MDESSSKTHSSLFPIESSTFEISDQDFNLFHSIDRELYTRLIHNLSRDPTHSIQIMAFWMWLERESKDMHFIKRLLSLPLPLLNDVVEETALCLRCVDEDGFLYGGNEVLTLLPEILSDRINNVVSLRLFHDNRVAVARAVTRIINTVCARAFGDILRRAWRENAFVAAAESAMGQAAPAPAMVYQPHIPSVPFVPLPAVAGGGLLGVPAPMSVLAPPAAGEVVGLPVHMVAAAGSFPAYDFVAQRQMIGNELGDMLSRSLGINNNNNNINNNNNNISGNNVVVNGGGEEIEVAADERTIFLTFSKGYPISEEEVTDFFTRRFGDFIEDLIMQEVGEDEQVLYARMVARSAAVIDGIVGGNKAKYVINGKHVWARKYVKKQHQTRWPTTGGDEPSPSSSTTVHGEQSLI